MRGVLNMDAHSDLTPFQVLPHLKHLDLTHMMLDSLCRSSPFDMVLCSKLPGVLLHELCICHITARSVLDFCTNGLSACSKRQLLNSEANIGAGNQAETTAFLQAQLIVPHSILALTVLTNSLHMWCYNDSKYVQLDWPGQLPSLQSSNLLFVARGHYATNY